MNVIVRPWRDEVVEGVGYQMASWYVEMFWLPIIGPTGLVLARRLSDMDLAREVRGLDTCEVDLAELAVALGLGPSIGEHGAIVRTLKRLANFGIIHITRRAANGSEAAIEVRVRRALAPLTPRQVARLPRHLQVIHRGGRAEAAS